jgi:hypothetical protein
MLLLNSNKGAIMTDNVDWQWYHDGSNPLVGQFVEGNYIRVLELDKDFTLGEALDMIEEFNTLANGEVEHEEDDDYYPFG